MSLSLDLQLYMSYGPLLLERRFLDSDEEKQRGNIRLYATVHGVTELNFT